MILSAYISGASHLIYSCFWLILDLSSFIGQNLVHLILVILGFITRLIELTLTFLRVIYKDFIFFFEDLTENFSCCIAFLVENIFNIRDGMISVSSVLIHGVKTLPKLFCEFLNCLSSCLSALGNFTKAVLTLLWDGFLLIGSSFWLAVVNMLPGILFCIKKFFEQLLYLLFNILNFFGTVTTSILLNGVQNIFNFICNIPYCSVLGSVLTIILFYMFIKNFNMLCILSFNMSLAFWKYLSSLMNSVFMGHFLGRNSHTNNDVNRLIEDKLCVICQDRFREVVIMPCRHLCLCVNCKSLLINNHRACPICRTNIEGMMKVYI